MYTYQKTNEYFAQIAGGLEEEGRKELSWLGAKKIVEEYRGLTFKADKATLYRVNYKSRLVSRVLAPIASFKCKDQDALYNAARAINWSDFLTEENTFAVFANVSDSNIDNSHFASLKLKDAVADYFRDTTDIRPNVDTKNPDLWINLHIRRNNAVISIDTSGGSLHRRGYRIKKVDAPMQETLAAAIIQLSEWDGEQNLYDPMCGSGTLLCEALMYAGNIPAGYLRNNFGFKHLPDFDPAIWNEILRKGKKQIRQLPQGLITGSDISRQAVTASIANVNKLPGGKLIEFSTLDFREIGNLNDTLIVCNPPYGIRLQRGEDMSGFYKNLGDFLKMKCKGSTAYIYFGELKYLKNIGLKASWKIPLKNGGLDGRLAKYEMY